MGILSFSIDIKIAYLIYFKKIRSNAIYNTTEANLLSLMYAGNQVDYHITTTEDYISYFLAW